MTLTQPTSQEIFLCTAWTSLALNTSSMPSVRFLLTNKAELFGFNVVLNINRKIEVNIGCLVIKKSSKCY